jgi:hypothetical protein
VANHVTGEKGVRHAPPGVLQWDTYSARKSLKTIRWREGEETVPTTDLERGHEISQARQGGKPVSLVMDDLWVGDIAATPTQSPVTHRSQPSRE